MPLELQLQRADWGGGFHSVGGGGRISDLCFRRFFFFIPLTRTQTSPSNIPVCNLLTSGSLSVGCFPFIFEAHFRKLNESRSKLIFFFNLVIPLNSTHSLKSP